MSPLAELNEYVVKLSARCRAMQWVGALFHVTVISDIVADEVQVHNAIEQDAYSAEQLDLLALKAIDAGDVALAKRYIARSADENRKIGLLARV